MGPRRGRHRRADPYLYVFANRTDRSFTDVTYRINTLPQNTSAIITDFIGDRIGGRIPRQFAHGRVRRAHLRAKSERETANTFAEQLQPTVRPRMPMLAGEQTTHAGFALWQLPVADRLILTLGGRIDDVVKVDRFETWRTTAAYLIPETGSKLRGSAGTGGKAPTLFQLLRADLRQSVAAIRGELRLGCRDRPDFLRRPRQRVGHLVREQAEQPDRIRQPRDALFQRRERRDHRPRGRADADFVRDWARLKPAYTYLRANDARPD